MDVTDYSISRCPKIHRILFEHTPVLPDVKFYRVLFEDSTASLRVVHNRTSNDQNLRKYDIKWNSREQFVNKYDKHMSNLREQDIKFAEAFAKKTELTSGAQQNFERPKFTKI